MTAWKVDKRVLEELGFAQVASAWSEAALTPRGRVMTENPTFFSMHKHMLAALHRVEEARALFREELEIPLGGTAEIQDLIVRASKASVLEGLEVMQCGAVLRVACDTRAFLMEHAAMAPRLVALGGQLPVHGALASCIEGAFEADGTLRDEASYALKGFRENVRVLHRRMRTQIEGYLKDEDFSENLQDDFFSVRGERYVLPVKASHRGRVPGIIHNASNSGETVFVEPQALVGLGNELTIAQSLVEEEERRILAEFSRDLGEVADDLELAMELLAKVDMAQAGAKLAERMDATVPSLATDAAWNLSALRHPLLVLQDKKVVPNDVIISPQQQVLVVSGPNAGGKTVTITAVGLTVLMLRAGLPVPVAPGSSLPLPRMILSLIGDHQNLEEDLSTFSSHVKCLAEMNQVADTGVLLLVDEIASGTDPTEGAALAQAILERLVEKGATVMLTTHLEAVKALGITNDSYINARVGFDGHSMLPTYQLELDVAGVSNALEVASQVGMETSVVQRARECLEGSGALTVALQKLSERELLLEQLRIEAQAEKTSLVRELEEARLEKQELERARLNAEEIVREEMAEQLEQTQQQLKEMIAELQNQPSIQATQKAQKQVKADQEALNKERERLRSKKSERNVTSPRKEVEIKVGAKVHVPRFNKDAEIVAIDGETIQVAVGPMKMRVSRDEIVGVQGGKSQKAKERRKVKSESLPSTDEEAQRRLDLRGVRADEVEMAVVALLDQAYYKGPPQITIVHGHGSGAVRKAVNEVLNASPYVKDFRYGDRNEGGDGATIVNLDV
jgi:DNA mismatch repair protein MutS2